MKVQEIKEHFQLEVVGGAEGLSREVRTGYCGDLLSDVMANAEKGAIWLTIQSHQNILAVALLKELAAIVLVNGRAPEKETIDKANEEGIPILVSSLTAFELAGRLYEIGIARADQ